MTTQAPAGQKYCSTCGTLIHERAEICPSCGVRQLGAVGAIGSKSKITAALLAILLGTVGAHRFYLGQNGVGILYLLCFWTGIPTIAGFIEGIIYLGMNDAAFAAKYP